MNTLGKDTFFKEFNKFQPKETIDSPIEKIDEKTFKNLLNKLYDIMLKLDNEQAQRISAYIQTFKNLYHADKLESFMSEEKVKSLISFEITKILWNNEWIKSSSEVDRNISIPKNVPELDEPKEVKDVKKKAIVKKEPIKAKKTVIEETKKEAPKAHKKTTDQVEKKVQDTSLHGILEQIKKQQRSSNLQESLKKYKTLVQKIEKEHSEIHTITNKISQIFKKIERYEANDLLKQYPDQIFRDIKSIINLI